MVVKNIAVSVFGVEYLKSHSVKGKASNKTKSIPRPAIDPTKALAIREKEAIQKHITKKTSKLNTSTNIDNTNPNTHDNLPTGLEKSPVGEVSSSEESDEESNSAGEDSMEQEKK
ncbi:uncharacterized protein LOC123271606 [Cotesia glomerata]|uniref:uncharacterized protein LOC123271606 n=1 Tax=Cotesia glomerata TaxID=32391 RepID=UPI001D01CE44|nr:uncharacterized protein LOC123271606 [Cotesia glomerata]